MPAETSHASGPPDGQAAANPSSFAAALGESRHIDRREQRKETNWIAMIRLLDGTEIPCNVKDVSPSGAKLGVPSVHELPETFMLKVIGRDFVCLVKLAWRRGNYAGVKIERVGKLAVAEKAEVRPETPSDKALSSRRNKLSMF